MSQRSAWLVVAGCVLAVIGLARLRHGDPKSVRQAAANSIRRGDLQTAAATIGECEPPDGGPWSDSSLGCVARLASLEFNTGHVAEARVRVERALAEANRLGTTVSNNTHSELEANPTNCGTDLPSVRRMLDWVESDAGL